MTAPTRITRSRAKGWRKPEGAVIVSRGTIWGNPWIVGNLGWLDALDTRWQLTRAMKQADAKAAFSEWLSGTPYHDLPLPDLRRFTDAGIERLLADLAARRALILRRLPELRGRDLVCWCKPGCDCHADVLMEMANG